jgi:hypothetical protein
MKQAFLRTIYPANLPFFVILLKGLQLEMLFSTRKLTTAKTPESYFFQGFFVVYALNDESYY